MVPAVLEKVGSVVQREKADPVLLTLTTDSTLGSYERVASTALMLSPFGTARMVAVKVCPTEYEPVLGTKDKSAAYADKANTKKAKPLARVSINE